MKICTREQPMHQGWYRDGKFYKCRYCDGIIIDKGYIRKIIDYNTPVDLEHRNREIDRCVNESIPFFR